MGKDVSAFRKYQSRFKEEIMNSEGKDAVQLKKKSTAEKRASSKKASVRNHTQSSKNKVQSLR